MSLVTTPSHELATCHACRSTRTTSLAMTLTDGTPVRFVSCHGCEAKRWTGPDGTDLPVESVLERTRKPR